MMLETAKRILKFYEYELKDAPCSINHHLNVKGGLMIHLNNVKSAAEELDPENETLIALAYIHNIGKARTYNISYGGIFNNEIKFSYAKPAVDHLINTIVMITEAGFRLTQEELHALQFHHGGWSPFAHNASLTELAVKLHAADMIAMSRENKGR